MNSPKFLIASTGRSGSGYISKVLRAYGINCGHEEYWRFPWQRRVEGLDGDSSWLAVKYLDSFNGIIFHQVRHPLKVLSSLMDTYRDKEYFRKKYLPFREELMPLRTGDLMQDFMSMIVWMNKEIEQHAVYGWKVEELSGKHIVQMFNYLGIKADYGKLNKAIDSIPNTYNKHNNGHCLTWDDIPDSKVFRQMAERYGYK